MAIQWGGWSGHLRVGIEVATSGYDTYTPSIEVHVRTFVQCDGSFNFSDNQTLTLSGSVGATYNFFNGLQANQVLQTGTYIIYGQGQSYGGGPGYYFEARLSGAYNGAAPAVGVNFSLPPRPQRPPAPPSYAPTYIRLTAVDADLQWGGTTDDGGSGLIEDNLQASRNPEFTSLIHDSYAGGTSRTVSGLSPGTMYWYRARVRNGIGWSGWSGVSNGATQSFTMGSPTLSDIAPDAATATWTAPGGAVPSGYQIQVARDANFTTGVATTTVGTWGTSLRLTGFVPGTKYWVRIRANTSTGYGGWSGGVAIETLSGAKVRVGTQWRDAPAYVRVNGQWRVAKVNKRLNGSWVL